MKKDLIKNLKDDVYCRIKPSKKHGVGVFAIKDIPKNVNPFQYTNNKCIKSKIINIKEDEIKSLPKEIKKMIDDILKN